MGFRQINVLQTFARALKASEKLHPLHSRETIPAPMVSAVASEMKRRGYSEGAHMTMLALDTYLRPGVLTALTWENVVPSITLGKEVRPTCLLVNLQNRGPSKQGAYALSVMLDSPSRQYLSVWLEGLR